MFWKTKVRLQKCKHTSLKPKFDLTFFVIASQWKGAIPNPGCLSLV